MSFSLDKGKVIKIVTSENKLQKIKINFDCHLSEENLSDSTCERDVGVEKVLENQTKRIAGKETIRITFNMGNNMPKKAFTVHGRPPSRSVHHQPGLLIMNKHTELREKVQRNASRMRLQLRQIGYEGTCYTGRKEGKEQEVQ